MTADSAQPAIVIARRLSKRFGKREVVREVDFEVLPGRCFGFLGPNGAGKTTTLRMILGVSPITAGELRVFGESMPAAARSARRRIGVVPQADNLDPDFTVAENLRVYASYFDLPARAVMGQVRELLEFAGLSERAEARIDALSGGMKRRLTIARALINDPELLILDEPTTGLDPQARHMIWGRLRELIRAGKTLLLTTHYMEEAERLCDELVIMDHGRILTRGSPAALVQEYVEPEVLEIRGQLERVRELLAGVEGCRAESLGDTCYCYSADARPLIQCLEGRSGITFVHRPAGLEDVFLRLTGRELRD